MLTGLVYIVTPILDLVTLLMQRDVHVDTAMRSRLRFVYHVNRTPPLSPLVHISRENHKSAPTSEIYSLSSVLSLI